MKTQYYLYYFNACKQEWVHIGIFDSKDDALCRITTHTKGTYKVEEVLIK